MPSLAELQSVFGAALRHGDAHAFLDHVMDGGVPASLRLQIYRNTFAQTVIGSLELTFPAVCRLVGQDFFEVACLNFLEEQPPREAWLDAYGQGFPQFISGYQPAASVPYLADVASLELLVNKALRCTDDRIIDVSQLAALDDAQAQHVRFEPCPSLGLIRVATPADRIWSAVLSPDESALDDLIVDSGPAWLIVARNSSALAVDRLSAEAWRFAKALFDGSTVGRAVALAPGDAFQFLDYHLRRQHFRSFSITSDLT